MDVVKVRCQSNLQTGGAAMNSGQKTLGVQIDPKPSNSGMTAGELTVHAVTFNAEIIQPVSDRRVEQAAGSNTSGGTSAN
jgi:hypothetical protein